MLQAKKMSKWAWVIRATVLIFSFLAILSVRNNLQKKGLGPEVEAGLGLSKATPSKPMLRRATFQDKAQKSGFSP